MNVVVVVTHPIQYHAPLFRMLNAEPDLKLTAVFFSDHSVKGGHDKGFGQAVKWDIPLLEGYGSRFERNDGPGNPDLGFRGYRCSRFRRIFEDLKPDVVMVPGHGVQLYWQAVFAAFRMGIPVIIRPESLDGAQPRRHPLKSIVRKILLSQFYRRVTAFCATGYFSRRDAVSFGFSDEAIFSAPYCIDTELFEKAFDAVRNERDAIRSAMGVRPDQLVVIFMAKFIDWKNPSLILDAIESISEPDRGRISPLLVGSGPDWERVRDRAIGLTGSNTCCPGFVNQAELARYYAAADCAVLPSKRGHESWGLVVNEAMTCGLPVAVSDGVGCRVDLVENKGTGRIFKDGDARELGRILVDWQSDPVTRVSQGEAAARLIKNYSSRHAAAGVLRAVRYAVGRGTA